MNSRSGARFVLQLLLHFAHGLYVALLGAGREKFHAFKVVFDLRDFSRRFFKRAVKALDRGCDLALKTEARLDSKAGLEPEFIQKLQVMRLGHQDNQHLVVALYWHGGAA